MSEPKKETRPVEVPKNWTDMSEDEQNTFIDQLIDHWIAPKKA